MSAYDDGQQAYHGFQHSNMYYGLTDNPESGDAIRLFMPPEDQTLLQMETPEAPDRKEWRRGWDDARRG